MAVDGRCHTLSALPLVKSHGAHCRGGRVGLRASLDGHGEQKISCLHQRSNTGPSSLQQVIIPTTVKNSNVFLDVTWCNLMTSKYLNEHVFSVFMIEQLKALIPFDVRGCVNRKCIFKYNQQDATLHNLFISVKCSTCFRRFLHPSSGAQNCIYSIGYFVEPFFATCHCRGRVGTEFQLFHGSGR